MNEDLIVERLLNRVRQANTLFLQQIATNISRLKGLSSSDAHKLAQILKYGSSYNDIVKKISKYLNANVDDVDNILSEYAKKDAGFYEKFYKYRNIPMTQIEQNLPLKTQMNAISKVIKDQFYSFTRPNISGYTLTDINGKSQFYSLKDTFNKVIDEALLNVSQGKQTFDSSMSKILTEIGQSGLRKIQYESGRSVRLDSVVRTQILDGIRNLHNATQQIYGEQFDSDGVEITVHELPAPDHADVQGKQFSTKSENGQLSEWQKLQNGQDAKDYKGNTYNLDHDNKNGYRPISTMNCYHTVFSIILGVSKPQYTDQQLAEIKRNSEKLIEIDGKKYNRYQCTQLQRNLERKIREQKDIQIMAKQSNNKQLINKSQQKITQLTQKYKQISEQSNLPTKMNRLKVSGYKRVSRKNDIVNSEKLTIENFKDDDLINFVDVKELDKFKTHSKTGKYSNKTPDQYEQLKQDIIKNGIKDGGNLLYDETTGYTIINEGNNRLAIAQELGFKKYPIYVTKTKSNQGYKYSDRGVYLKKGLVKDKGKYIKFEDLK